MLKKGAGSKVKNKMARKKKIRLLEKSLEELKQGFESREINVFGLLDCIGKEFDERIFNMGKKGSGYVRDAQIKILDLFDYLSQQENLARIGGIAAEQERMTTHEYINWVNVELKKAKETYQKLVQSYHLTCDKDGLIIDSRKTRPKQIKTTYNPPEFKLFYRGQNA